MNPFLYDPRNITVCRSHPLFLPFDVQQTHSKPRWISDEKNFRSRLYFVFHKFYSLYIDLQGLKILSQLERFLTNTESVTILLL